MAHPSAVSGRIAVRMLDGVAARDEARRLWTALEADLGGAPALSCSWAWTETWLDSFGAAVPHRFAVAEGAIALVTRAPAAFPRPRAWHLGTAGEPAGASVFVERNRLLARPEARAPFAAALVAELERERGWDRLRLDGLHADDAALLLDALGGPSPRVAVTVEQSPVADLQEGDDVLAQLSGSRRQRIRRSLRAFGELSTEWAQTPQQGAEILDELIALHQQRWTAAGEPGAFADARYVAFHRALVARLLPRQQVALVRVRRAADGETVGCLYGLRDGDRLCFYQGGLRQYDDNRLRAGVAGHIAFMRACREHGLASYDFLAPATRYKSELAAREETLSWIEVSRPAAWRLRLSDATRALRARR
ncbi:GNAT family N-acetyltransferase [Conexibacter sp. JD483]|uniref:GNAT family N-acetyltransferase n=1 Tax=unclassified Conexibacter TaxID=2627773 RepID=UPI00271E6875|nr:MULTISPECIES: GNAT family N-acetyltransferase [unclassified Conexibacter]MDO8184226.1 GNAT family N-acetyltransferase [Conexibacter sp. CPCC 205706]MDO8197218.1 GNAT family N-acetyltransferase [Conexibacter sp. CPCC 205762]MDR9367467.1 GNAT family N-acetyltransferase [Conexibacter sp. JD483]